MGALIGVARGPILAYYASVNPSGALAGGRRDRRSSSAAFGAYGYATRRDLSKIGRISFFALLGLIVFGLVMMFVSIPGGNVIYAVLGLVIFAGYTMYDFQRLRRAGQIEAAPLLAASIFLDIFNVFMLHAVAPRRRPQLAAQSALGYDRDAQRRAHAARAVVGERAPER